MKAKSLSLQIISFLVTFATGLMPGLSPKIAIWVGLGTFIGTMILNKVASSGEWPKGWSSIMWITNISGCLIEIAQYMADSGLATVQLTLYVIMGINAFLFSFIKDYKTETSIVR